MFGTFVDPNFPKQPENVEIEIAVTEEHCHNGKAGSEVSCPVALAIKEKVISRVTVEVKTWGIIFFQPGRYPHDRTLPQEVSQRILAFDRGAEMKPFSFKIKVPANLLRECPT